MSFAASIGPLFGAVTKIQVAPGKTKLRFCSGMSQNLWIYHSIGVPNERHELPTGLILSSYRYKFKGTGAGRKSTDIPQKLAGGFASHAVQEGTDSVYRKRVERTYCGQNLGTKLDSQLWCAGRRVRRHPGAAP